MFKTIQPKKPRRYQVAQFELDEIIAQTFGRGELTPEQQAYIAATYQVIRYPVLPIPQHAEQHSEILAERKAERDEMNAGLIPAPFVPKAKDGPIVKAMRKSFFS